jgi:hypothetical protein
MVSRGVIGSGCFGFGLAQGIVHSDPYIIEEKLLMRLPAQRSSFSRGIATTNHFA